MGANIITREDYLKAVLNGMPSGYLARARLDQGKFRNDDSFAAFLARELEVTNVRIMQVPLAELPLMGGGIINVDTSLPDGADSFTYAVEDGTGQAAWHDDYAVGELPTVDVSIEDFRVPVREFGLGYQLTTKDMRNSAFAGRGDLQTKLSGRAMRGMNEFHEFVGMFGDATRGVDGFCNHPLVPTLLPSFQGGTVTSSSWLDKDGDFIQSDIISMKQLVIDNTNGLRQIGRIVLPLNVWVSLDRPYVTGTGVSVQINSLTIKQYLLSQNPDIQFGPVLRLQSSKSAAPPLTPNDPTAPQLADDTAVAWMNSPEIVEYNMPISPRFGTPQWAELKLKTPGYSTTAGTVWYEPFAACYMAVN